MSGVTFKVKRSKSLMPHIKDALKPYQITAGIHQDAGNHVVVAKTVNGRPSYEMGDEPVAQIAAKNEYGTGGVPERPAFRASFFNNRKKYLKMLTGIAQDGLQGHKITISDFNAVGAEAKKDIETSIVSGNWIANSESTQLKKGGGKQKINDPLIDTGQVLNSVGYKVTKQ